MQVKPKFPNKHTSSHYFTSLHHIAFATPATAEATCRKLHAAANPISVLITNDELMEQKPHLLAS